ncbi:hypothetical protein [Aeromonas phage phiWae14]|nr:hypothetical protein [Aeromonas phage phiWae14]
MGRPTVHNKLDALVRFMAALGYEVANGAPWRGFKRGRVFIRFFIAKYMYDFACIDGSGVYKFSSTTPNLVIINEMTLTGVNREYRFLRNVWNLAVRKHKTFSIYGVRELQVDKKRRIVFDCCGMLPIGDYDARTAFERHEPDPVESQHMAS